MKIEQSDNLVHYSCLFSSKNKKKTDSRLIKSTRVG